jgi:hypothetical protein
MPCLGIPLRLRPNCIAPLDWVRKWDFCLVQHVQFRSGWVQNCTLGQQFLYLCLGLSVLGLFHLGQGVVVVVEMEQK